jgi:hypothetical protein
MPATTAWREDTDFALRPRSAPTGFSRGQALKVGGLRTASRFSQHITRRISVYLSGGVHTWLSLFSVSRLCTSLRIPLFNAAVATDEEGHSLTVFWKSPIDQGGL